jgi:hypothetical protein
MMRTDRHLSGMSRLWFLLSVLVLCCFICLTSISYAAPKRLLVAEIVDNTGKKEWRNQLIALGIAGLLANELYESGRYAPVETDADALAMIREHLKDRWMHSQQEDLPEMPLSEEELYKRADCDAIAKAVVKKFSTRRISSIGLFSASRTTVEVEVEITVKEKEGQSLSASGKGTAETKSVGVLFQIRNDKVFFDETTVGQATRKAVHDAVAKLF